LHLAKLTRGMCAASNMIFARSPSRFKPRTVFREQNAARNHARLNVRASRERNAKGAWDGGRLARSGDDGEGEIGKKEDFMYTLCETAAGNGIARNPACCASRFGRGSICGRHESIACNCVDYH